MTTQLPIKPTSVSREISRANGHSAGPAITRKHRYSLHAAVWRWHFYAGLLVAPFILIASFTGTLLVFADEFNEWYYAPLQSVPEGDGSTASIDGMIGSIGHALAPLGKIEVGNINLPAEPGRSASSMALVDGPDGKYYVYAFVNPSTGEYIGHYVFEQSPMRQIEQLHRRLLWPRDRKLGTVTNEYGSLVVELATSWAVVLTLTGLYLWLPRHLRQVWGVWVPRMRGRAYRLWRDWHTVPSFYLATFTLIILITGLIFSTWWGAGFVYVQRASADGNEPISLFFKKEVRDPNQPVLSLDEIHAIVRNQSIPAGASVELDTLGPDSRYALAHAFNQNTFNPVSSVYWLIDRHTGEIVEEQRWEGYNLLTKLRVLSYSVHVGSIYGLPTKVLAFVVTLVICFATISGFMMWWKRRPRGKTGLPPRPRAHAPVWVIVAILAVTAFFPAAGLSFLAVLLLDRTVLFIRNRARGPTAA